MLLGDSQQWWMLTPRCHEGHLSREAEVTNAQVWGAGVKLQTTLEETLWLQQKTQNKTFGLKKKKCIRAPCFVFRKMREAGSGQVDLMCLLKMSQKKF